MKLKPSQKQILHWLANHPEQDFTRREIASHTGLELTSVCARINELSNKRFEKKTGIQWIKQSQKRPCTLSQQTVSTVQISLQRKLSRPQ